jgi:hypothetical protein
MNKAEMQAKNRRTAWVLASVAAAFLLGFVAKILWLGA